MSFILLRPAAVRLELGAVVNRNVKAVRDERSAAARETGGGAHRSERYKASKNASRSARLAEVKGMLKRVAWKSRTWPMVLA